ncbi:MAG TPA: HEAT repeat domain-containing protein [Gemmatimonadales bacterium]|nr:HEAT repeat domain-containing protein [Gemmatimonadales bacterium]
MNATDTFIARFGDLVAMLRVDPGNDAAQELALTAALRAVAAEPVVVEAGFDRGEPGEDLTLQGRMRARYIDVLRVAPSADPADLLTLARAFSHDSTPVVPATGIELERFPVVERMPEFDQPPTYSPARADGERRAQRDRRQRPAAKYAGRERRRGGDRRKTGERRLRLLKQQEADIGLLGGLLGRAIATGAWSEAIEHARTLIDLSPRVPAVERRTFGILTRRQLSRAVLAQFVDHAIRDPADRAAAGEVLRWTGTDGIEVMLDAVCRSEVVGARRFLHDALGSLPEAYAAVTPLLESRAWHEVHHAAGILGMMGLPEALPLLRPLLDHADPRVRSAVVHAIAAFPAAESGDALHAALGHATAATRAAAADAIGGRRLASFAMPIVAALETERDAAAWRAMAGALAAIGTPEACAALAMVAVTARTITGGGYGRAQRLEAVRALAHANSRHAVGALERVAREADGAVRAAAEEALASVNASAG